MDRRSEERRKGKRRKNKSGESGRGRTIAARKIERIKLRLSNTSLRLIKTFYDKFYMLDFHMYTFVPELRNSLQQNYDENQDHDYLLIISICLQIFSAILLAIVIKFI